MAKASPNTLIAVTIANKFLFNINATYNLLLTVSPPKKAQQSQNKSTKHSGISSTSNLFEVEVSVQNAVGVFIMLNVGVLQFKNIVLC